MFKNKKRLIFLIIFNFALLSSIVYIFEFFLYLGDPARKLPVNGMQKDGLYTWGNLVEDNSYGFREKEFITPKPEGVYRIMVLGDSLTWGAGLAPEQRYSNLIERYLSEKFIGNKFEVLNFGISGGPTVVERDILLKYKEIVQPDLIIIGFCLNDPQSKEQNYSTEREAFDKKYAYKINAMADVLDMIKLDHTAVKVKISIYNLAESINIFPSWPIALDRVYEKNSNKWQKFEEALDDIKKSSDKSGLDSPIFAVLNQGMGDFKIDYGHPDQQLQHQLNWYHQAEDSARKSGFEIINFEKELAEEMPNQSLALNVLDAHPSVKLNELYARKISDSIAKLIIK